MSDLLAMAMVGAGAAGAVQVMRNGAGHRVWSALGSMGSRRRAGIEEAAGWVLGGDGAHQRLARNQVLAATTTAVVAGLAIAPAPTTTSVVALVGLVALAWHLPVMMARSREQRRRTEVDVELVDTMGELVMAVETGLTLDVALNRYAAGRESALASEFRRYLDLVQLGWSRPDALAEFGRRNPTPIVALFVTAVAQNQRLGTPLASVLRQQAATARRQRRQAVEERAAKLPMKMIFPTVFCVLPVLMIVVVGPAIVRLLEVL